MGIQIDKNKLIQAMKDYVYVSTESGPVVPSKTKVIKMLTKQTPKPVSKPQDGDDWDTREYGMNKPLNYGKNLITTRDLYQKVFTEAVSNKNYRGMRMNLSSIDMKESHCKFLINRRDHDMMVELFYPNDNDNISVILQSDTGLSNEYEVPLDSPQFVNNFGYTILKTCDQLIDSNNTYNVGNDLDTMQTIIGLGNGTEDLSNSWHAEDSAIYRESVDSGLGQLLNLCNAVALLEDGEDMGGDQDPNAAKFAAAGGDLPSPADMQPMNSGDVNGGDDASPSPDDMVNFKEFLLDNQDMLTNLNASGSDVGGSAGGLDNLAKVVSEKLAEGRNDHVNTGTKLSKDEIYNGTTPIKNMNAASLINAFFDQDEWISLAELAVPKKKVQEFVDYLNNPQTDSITLTAFNEKIHELFPEAYESTPAGVDPMSTDTLSLPSEDSFGSSVNAPNLDNPADLSGVGMDDSSFMDDGSMDAMMDQVGGEEIPLPEDMPEEEFGADNGPSQQAVDNQDEVIGAMANI
jgi:hypothetical protein